MQPLALRKGKEIVYRAQLFFFFELYVHYFHYLFWTNEDGGDMATDSSSHLEHSERSLAGAHKILSPLTIIEAIIKH